MRSRYPHLHLQGNKQQAKKWIPWATKALDRLKLLVAGEPVNRVLRPVNGTLVRVRSVVGHDFISINVLSDLEYTCEFPLVSSCAPSNCSDFLLRCWTPHNAVGFLMRTPIGYWDNYHWDFGDGNTFDGGDFTGGWNLSHEYDEPGTYTVSVTATKDVITTFDAGSANATDRILGQSFDPGATANAAYTAYLAASPIPAANPYSWTSQAVHNWMGVKRYDYLSQEDSRTYDLSSIAANATVTAVIKLAKLDWVVHYPNYGDAGQVLDNGSPGVTSNLGVTAVPIVGGEFAPFEDFDMGDLTSFIGNPAKIVSFADSGGYLQLPAYMPGIPTFAADTVQNIVGIIKAGQGIRIETPTDKKTTTKVIKVNSGRPKKTRQIGESVHT